MVLVFAYYNDILHNIRVRYWGSPKPLTEVINGQIVPTNLPLPEPVRAEESGGVRIKTPVRIEGSVLKALVAERILIGAPDLYNRLSRAGLWDPWEPEAVTDELRVYKSRARLPELAQAWERTAAIFKSLGETIRARGATPVLVHIPAQFEISARDWRLTSMRYGIEPEAWDRRLVSRRLGGIASSSGWAFLDLAPALMAASSALGQELYLPYDGHWNPRGHDVAAQAVVTYLRERNLLRCSPGRLR